MSVCVWCRYKPTKGTVAILEERNKRRVKGESARDAEAEAPKRTAAAAAGGKHDLSTMVRVRCVMRWMCMRSLQAASEGSAAS